jgi:hypothetical protein
MKSLSRRFVAGAALLGACDLSIPTEPLVPVDLVLDFCADDVPVWFAYQNQDGATVRVLPDAGGTFRFTATNRVVIAMVWQEGADYHTEFVYATNRELEALSTAGCLEEAGTKTVNGTVSGFGAGQVSVMSMGFATTSLVSGNASYSLTNLPDRPLDLIASRQGFTGTQRIADRLVIRRTQTFVNNGMVPAIDFDGAEAVAPTTASATVSGILSGEFAYLQNNFFSQLETSHSLSYVEDITNASYTFAAVPLATLAAGDYHDLILLAVNSGDASVRGVENYFRGAVAQTLPLGPPLAQPAITQIQNQEYLRLRMQVGLQNSYDDAISVRYLQQLPLSVTTVSLWGTIGYLRAVFGNWTLDIPDVTGADGWQDAWGMKLTAPVDWTVTAFGGRSELMFGAKPSDGEFVRYAIRSSLPTAQVPIRAASRTPVVRRAR